MCCVQHWCMQQKVFLLNVTNIGQNMGEEIYSHTLLTDCDTTNVPMCQYHGKGVPIKLTENPSPLVHLHSKQDKKTNKELFYALISDMKP